MPAEAVVVDVGAQMSHAVIVSRELGIPCVVSVTAATRRIPDGALVEVDGAGTCGRRLRLRPRRADMPSWRTERRLEVRLVDRSAPPASRRTELARDDRLWPPSATRARVHRSPARADVGLEGEVGADDDDLVRLTSAALDLGARRRRSRRRASDDGGAASAR